MMPKMNGMEVCRRVKKELVIDNVFIVLLTAKGQELDRQKGQEVGADVYMTKPFDPEAILNKARTVLELN
jgi:DNA-binding response OmpR family regulator